MNKIVIIAACGCCPFYDNEYHDYLEECMVLNRKVDPASIPDDCPLTSTDEPETDL